MTDWLSKWIDAYRYIRMEDQRKDDPHPKKKKKKKEPPPTCLPMIWKILTAQIREVIYDSLISQGLFPEEQKERRRGATGTREQLYIRQYILKDTKTRRKNIAIAWIDYKKAYIVPQSWIIDCLKCARYPVKS